MSKIDNLAIRRIIDAADIVDVVSQFVTLKKKGPRYIGLCPFHEDRHATNFVVQPGKGYKCFACEAKGDAVKFIMEHERLSFIDAIRWLGKHYGIPTDDVPLNYTPPIRKEPKPLPMLEIKMDYVLKRLRYKHDNLVDWIWSLTWDGAQYGRIDNSLTAYCIGHSEKYGHTIFWQIDEKQIVRTGKMMKYYPPTHPKAGHRDKDSAYSFDFVHAALFRDKRHPEYDDEKMEAKQCLFGQHLLNTWPNATVNIVESEKTALIMSIAYGNHAADIWMACGGLYNLTNEKLAPLIEQGRRIMLYPDKDGVKAWKTKAAEIGYKDIHINTYILDHYWKPEDGPKADVADIVLRLLKENNHGKG